MSEKDIILETQENSGEIKISNEVITAIAAQALAEIKGVSMAQTAAEGFVDKLVKKNSQRGVKIYMDEGTKNADIDVHIMIAYGINIPEISWKVQDAVKKNVEAMTDISVNKVNVFVDNVSIEKEPKPIKPKKVKEEKVSE